MEINTITFLFLFLPLLLVSKLLVPKSYNNILILIFGIIFYLLHNPIYVILILIISNINYYLLKRILESDNNKKRKLILLLITNILITFIPNIILKENNYIMILYTLQNISFIINSYNQNKLIEDKYIDFLAFSFIFPRVIGTNIINYNKSINKSYNNQNKLLNIHEGIMYIMLGYILNILLANSLENMYINIIELKNISFLTLIISIVSSSLAIILKIISYYLISKGVLKILDIDTEPNFNEKIIYKNMSDFMKNFYSSINNWIKEVLYTNLNHEKFKESVYYIVIFLIWASVGVFYRFNISGIIFGISISTILLLETLIPKIKKINAYHIALNIFLTILFSILPISIPKYIKLILSINKFVDKTSLYLIYTHLFELIIGIFIIFNIKKYIKIKPTLEYKIFKNISFLVLFIIAVALMFSNYYIPTIIY